MRSQADQSHGRLGKVFMGPLLATVSVVHPDTVKLILKTSGILAVTAVAKLYGSSLGALFFSVCMLPFQ